MSEITPIPKTKKAIKIKKKVAEAKEVPKDLQDAWAAVVAISTAHKMLQEGHFTYAHRNAVGVSLAFLEELHEKAFQDAARHEKADMIPELKTLIEKVKNEQKPKDN